MKMLRRIFISISYLLCFNV